VLAPSEADRRVLIALPMDDRPDRPVAAGSLAEFLDRRDVRLHVRAHAGVSVRIDRDSFQRALSNVIDNAVRYTPPGGTMEVTCGEDGDGIFVRVGYDGPGIAPDLLASVFEPIFRADLARHNHTDGPGPRTHHRSPPTR
jgi:signal transduction histidine kinase